MDLNTSDSYSDYLAGLPRDVTWLKKRLVLLHGAEDRITLTCRKNIASPDGQDLAIFFWKYFTIGTDVEDTVKELALKQRHLRIVSRKETPHDKFSERIISAKTIPIDSLIDFKHGYAICLWHDDHHPSMYYYKKSNRIKCFSCQYSGDAIDVSMKLFSLSFKESVDKLVP